MNKKVFNCMLLLMFFGFTSLYSGVPQPISPEWERTFGGVRDDICRDFIQTKSGDYVMVGQTLSYHLNQPRTDAMVVKTDGTGNLLWEKVMWGSHNGGLDAYDVFYSVKEISTGGYIIAGYSQVRGGSSMSSWLIKLDPDGNLEWESLINPQYTSGFSTVIETPDGGFITCGWTGIFGHDWDGFINKFDVNGNQIWQRILDFENHQNSERFYSMEATTDNGYILSGCSYVGGNSTTTPRDFLLVKIDDSGNPEWMKKKGGAGDDHCNVVKQAADGGYVMAGLTKSYGAGESDIWMIKTDGSGNTLWDKTYGGPLNESANSLVIKNSRFIVGGSTSSYNSEGHNDIYLVYTDQNGNEEFSQTIGGTEHDDCFALDSSADGGLMVAGDFSPGGVARDFYLAKILWVSKEEYTLKVKSTHGKGANIIVTPFDINGNGNGAAPFIRTYYEGTVVTLTAPEVHNVKHKFDHWKIDGRHKVKSISIQIVMDGNHRAKAYFVTPKR